MSGAAKKLTVATAWRLLRASWRDYRRYFKTLLLITGLVVLPINLINLTTSLGQDASFAAYSTLVSIFMNVALIYAIVRLLGGAAAPRLREAYYEGTARVLAFMLASAALIAMLVPAAFAITLYIIGASSPEGTSVSGGELALIGILALILAVPSIWLVVRFILGPYLVIAEALTPIAALRRARGLTLGRFWLVLGRLTILLIAILILAFVIILPSYLLGLLFHSEPVLQFFFQTILSLIALPIADLYLVHLLRQLSKAE